MPHSLAHRVAVLVAFTLSMPVAGARAGNLDSFFFGPESSLMGGAILATATGGEAIWYNPAGLAATDRNSFDLTVTAYNLRLRRFSDGLEAVFPESRQTADLDGTELIIAASALTSTFRLTDRVLLGFGVFITDKDRIRIDSEFSEATDDGAEAGFSVQLWSDTEVYRIGPCVGIRVSDRLRVGVGLLVTYGALTQRVRLGFRGTDADPETSFSDVAELAEVDTDRIRIGLEPVVGLQWEALERLRVGFLVRGPSTLIAEQAKSRIVDVIGLIGPEVTPIVELTSDRDDTNFDFKFDVLAMPRFSVGLAWLFDKGQIALEGDLRPGLTNEDLDVDDALTWNLRIGGIYDLSPGFSLGAGLFTDRSPTRDTGALEGVADFYGLALGAVLRSPVQLDEDERAPTIVFTSSFGFRYALGVGEIGAFQADVSNLLEGAGGLGQGDLVDVVVHEVALNLGTGVRF